MTIAKPHLRYAIANRSKLTSLLRDEKYRRAFQTLNHIEKDLNERFAEMKDAIRVLILAALSGEPLLYIGDPGTGKSRLIRAFCQYLGVYPLDPKGEHPRYFEYLLTPFTEPGELFGYYMIEEDKNGSRRINRPPKPEGMMQSTDVVYLDEVFNGSSAILNSLLSFMNERRFHDRDKWVQVDMKYLFGATNLVPETPELRAVYDRFLLRCFVHNIDPKVNGDRAIEDLLEKGWSETYNPPKSLDKSGFSPSSALISDLNNFREGVGQALGDLRDQLFPDNDPQSREFLKMLNMLVREMRRTGLSNMSNRRMVKFLNLIILDACYQAALNNSSDMVITDRQVGLWKFLIDRRDSTQEHILQTNFGG